MHEQPFPFWTSEKVHTYTEVQDFCVGQYRQRGPGLIEQARKNLENLGLARSKQDAFRILCELEQLSLSLSCFNGAWVDFSEAVFEVVVLPSRASLAWTHKFLTGVFEDTLRRIKDGTSRAN